MTKANEPLAREPERKRRGRSFIVNGVDLGDGKRVRVWMTVNHFGVTIRQFQKHRRWYVPLADAAGILARRGQIRLVKRRQGELP